MPRSTKSAEELLGEFRESGRQEPFEELVRRYAPMVFNTCFRVTKDKHDAEDATQAVFLSLAVQVKANKEIRYIGPWLQQVGHRMALDMRRSHKRRKVREEKHSTMNGDRMQPAPDSADSEEVKRILTEELGELPSKYRTPLVLFYFGGMSREQIASELRCKPSTLGVRMHRAREMLGTRLTRRGLQISGAMLAVALANVVRSAIATSLIERTSEVATRITFGGPIRPGAVSTPVMRLVRGAGQAMVYARIRAAVAAVFVAASAIAAGAGAASQFHSSLKILHPTEIQFQNQLDPRPWIEGIIKHLPNLLPTRVQNAVPQSSQAPVINSPATPPAPTDHLAQATTSQQNGNLHPLITGPMSVAVANVPVTAVPQPAPASSGFAPQQSPPSVYAAPRTIAIANNSSEIGSNSAVASAARSRDNSTVSGIAGSMSIASVISPSSIYVPQFAVVSAPAPGGNSGDTSSSSQEASNGSADSLNPGPIALLTNMHSLPTAAISSLASGPPTQSTGAGPENFSADGSFTSDTNSNTSSELLASSRHVHAMVLSFNALSAVAPSLPEEEAMVTQPLFAAVTPDNPETHPVTNFPSAPFGIDNESLAIIRPLALRAQAVRFEPQSVPEPGSLALLGASSFLLLRHRRSRMSEPPRRN